MEDNHYLSLMKEQDSELRELQIRQCQEIVKIKEKHMSEWLNLYEVCIKEHGSHISSDKYSKENSILDKTIGIGVIVIKDDKILVGKRGPACRHGSGQWAFPGGHLEDDETVIDCMYREVEEEAGINIGIEILPFEEPILAVTDHLEHQGVNHLTFWTVSVWVSGDPVVKEPTKCTEWAWKTLDELKLIPGVYDPESPAYYWLPMHLLEKYLAEIEVEDF